MNTNIHQTIGYIKGQNCIHLLITAFKGSTVKSALKTTTASELLAKGFDDNALSMSVEASDELERLIRHGVSLSEALNTMVKNGWLQRLDEETN